MSKVPVTVTVDPARYRPSDNLMLWGDRSRIERELGWKPEIPLNQTLSDLLDYWRKEVGLGEDNTKERSCEGLSPPL